MKYNEIDIKNGIKLHTIKTEKFKTNLIAVMLTTKLDRKNITKNALIPAVLRRGTKFMQTQEEINKKMEDMYGASFDCGLDKTGDNQILKFYMETVNNEFLPQDAENMIKNSIEKIFEIIFNPYLENGVFKKEYVEQEKENIKQIIDGKIDSKARYALDRCIEEMYKNEPFGLYKFGYVEDLKDINEKNLYEYYLELIKTCKIDIYISGIVDENIYNIIKQNENIEKLEERKPDFKEFELVKKCVIFYMVIGKTTERSFDEVLKDFEIKIKAYMVDKIPQYLSSTLKKDDRFSMIDAVNIVKSFISKLMNLNTLEIQFINEFENGNYKPDLLFNDQDIINRIKGHPMALWKISNK